MNGYEIRRFRTEGGNFFVYVVDTLLGKHSRIIVGEGYYVDPDGDILPKEKGKKNPRRKSAMHEVDWAERTFGDEFHEQVVKGPLAEKLWGFFDLSIPKRTLVFGKPKESNNPFAALAGVHDSLKQAETDARMEKARNRTA